MEQGNLSPCVSPTLNLFASVLVCLCVSISMFGEHVCAQVMFVCAYVCLSGCL